MKNPAIRFLLALLLGTAAAAQTPIFQTNATAPQAVDPGNQAMPWPDVTDTQAKPDGSPLDRWQAQAEAGRARAASLVGRYWLEMVPQNPENCAKAIEWYLKAEKLGSSEAAGWLGHLYRRFDCPQRNLQTAIEWLRKAVPLMSFGAASDLVDLYSAADSAQRDPSLAYAYARVAAEVDNTLLGETAARERVVVLGQALDARQRKSADDLADKLLADIRKRRAALAAAPGEQKLKPSASGPGWSVGLAAYDDLRECASNTQDNCRGVRRAAYYDVANQGGEYLRCKFALDSRDFAIGTVSTHQRETLIPPKGTRRLFLGRIGEVAGAPDLRVSCLPVEGLAANVATGKCRVNTTGVPSVSDFYPPGSRQRNEEGRVVVYVWMDQKSGNPALVDLKESSGFPDLDAAGVRMGSYMAFTGDCDQGYSTVAISFRLAD